jgi:hypothetical protein
VAGDHLDRCRPGVRQSSLAVAIRYVGITSAGDHGTEQRITTTVEHQNIDPTSDGCLDRAADDSRHQSTGNGDNHRKVLVGAVILVPVLALVGGNVEDQLSVGGFVVSDSESAIGDEILEDQFGAGPADWVLVLSIAEGHRFTDADVDAAGLALTEIIEADEGVTEVVSFWNLGEILPTEPHPLRSVDRRHVAPGRDVRRRRGRATGDR